MKLVIRVLLLAAALGLFFAIEFALFGDYFDAIFNQQQCLAWFAGAKPFAWAIGIGLLIGDILLPVPASGVISALGAVYGVWLGAFIGLIGTIASAYTGYLLARFYGRRGAHLLASEEELARFQEFFDEWGGWAIIISRAMPILPEVIAILAGIARMKNSRFVSALLLGSLPPCLLFSYIGFSSRETPWLGIGGATLLPLLLWPVFLGLHKKSRGSKAVDSIT